MNEEELKKDITDDYEVYTYNRGIKEGLQKGKQEAVNKLNEILELFQDDSIYTGRIVKFEIKNRMKQLSKEIRGKKNEYKNI